MEELEGHEEPSGQRRPKGVEHGADPDRKTWSELRRREAEELGTTTQPYVVIVGAGQGGIALGARLYLALQLKARHAGIPTPVYGLQEVHHRS